MADEERSNKYITDDTIDADGSVESLQSARESIEEVTDDGANERTADQAAADNTETMDINEAHSIIRRLSDEVSEREVFVSSEQDLGLDIEENEMLSERESNRQETYEELEIEANVHDDESEQVEEKDGEKIIKAESGEEIWKEEDNKENQLDEERLSVVDIKGQEKEDADKHVVSKDHDEREDATESSEVGEKEIVERSEIRDEEIEKLEIRIQKESSEIRGDELERSEVRGDELERSDIRGDEIERSEIRGDEIERSVVREDEIERSEVRGDELERSDIRGDEMERSEIRGDEIERSEVRGDEIDRSEIRGDEIETSEVRGDEDQVESSEIINTEPCIVLAEDFYYEYEDHMSKPTAAEDSQLPHQLFTLDHSYGYDSTKRSNLLVLDSTTVAYAGGNYLHIVSLSNRSHTYLRSTSTGGIGAIAIEGSRRYIAVAEKGEMPNINIIEYSSLRLYRILKAGTQRVYSCVNFSPDGALLASVGGDPDYMLTIWDWRQERIILRCKAFSQDIYRVSFSSELQGILTTSGSGHIRFWKMAHTFTGLKLQGQLGKFGRKEISDIGGYVELADGKVLSGSEGGNLLLWDGGLIKVEICRKGRKTCHTGPIQQVLMDEGELLTVGVDGYIRVWDFETIDGADTMDDMEVFEMEPMNELRVSLDAKPVCIVKSADQSQPTIWYMQDSNGAIWRLDLSFSFTSAVPERLISFPAGPIVACQTSPNVCLVAALAHDGSVRVYDYITRSDVCMARYNSSGSCLLWPQLSVDRSGCTLFAGFADGVLRVLTLLQISAVDDHGRVLANQRRTELTLSQAAKPHTQRITCMALSCDGCILATGSEDSSVFFMTVDDCMCKPIGFVRTPSPVTHLTWSPASHSTSTVLISCSEGQVLEVDAPDRAGLYDTSKTFEISGLRTRRYQFNSIKSRLLHDEEMEKLRKEEEERKKQEEEERLIRVERGLEEARDETTSDNDEDDETGEKKKEVERVWEPYIPDKPSRVLCAVHSEQEGKFWLSMGDYDSGFLYECGFTDAVGPVSNGSTYSTAPTRALRIQGSQDVEILCITFSDDGERMYMGLRDGSVRVQLLSGGDVGLMTHDYWALGIHDSGVTSLAMSHDGRMLFSAATDGNLFSFVISADRSTEEAEPKQVLLPQREVSQAQAEDISDPNAYSIEDAKQKAEYERMLQLAEQKKASDRKLVHTQRERFQQVYKKNEQLPSSLRLHNKEFEMDSKIKQELSRMKEERVDAVRREMIFDTAKYDLAYRKVYDRYKALVECEYITLKAFRTVYEVSSFRNSTLSPGFYKVLEEMEVRKAVARLKDQLAELAKRMKDEGEREGEGVDGMDGREKSEIKTGTTIRGAVGMRITKALEKLEEQKKRRAARQAEWTALMSRKPDPDVDDPEELRAVREAELNMGDYKLKRSSQYSMQESQRLSSEKSREKLVLLKQLLHDRKLEFNARLLELRDKKTLIIRVVGELVAELNSLQAELESDDVKPSPQVPKLEACEVPERRYNPDQAELLAFKEGKQSTADVKELISTKAPSSVLRKPSVMMSQSQHSAGSPTPSLIRRTGMVKSSVVPVLGEVDDVCQEVEQIHEPIQSAAELDLRQREVIRKLYRRDDILRTIENIEEEFDAELRLLRHHKFILDVSIKLAEIRLMTEFEELRLLKEYDQTETILQQALTDKRNDLNDIQQQIAEAQQRLEQKKREIERYQEKEKQLMQSMLESVAENKFSDFLVKVYKKRVKRSNKTSGGGQAGGDDDDSSESDSDEDEWPYSESESESESDSGALDLDVCPPACDQSLYDNTCALRDKRLDLEEAITDQRKAREIMSKDLETLQKRSKAVEIATRSASEELEAFQVKKQQSLNELDTIVVLCLSQIEYIENNSIPLDLSRSLAFDSHVIKRLQDRIEELEQERFDQRKHMRRAQAQHRQLLYDKSRFEQYIGKLKAGCDKLMVDRFGRTIDIETLETVTINRPVEEAREKLSILEEECSKELARLDEELNQAKDDMITLIRGNTHLLDQTTVLVNERRDLEHQLNDQHKSVGNGIADTSKSEVEERERLINLVRTQTQQVYNMRREIALLSHKSGHLLPPLGQQQQQHQQQQQQRNVKSLYRQE